MLMHIGSHEPMRIDRASDVFHGIPIIVLDFGVAIHFLHKNTRSENQSKQSLKVRSQTYPIEPNGDFALPRRRSRRTVRKCDIDRRAIIDNKKAIENVHISHNPPNLETGHRGTYSTVTSLSAVP